MGWASGLQAGMRLGESIRQAQLERDLAEEAKKYKISEYNPEQANLNSAIDAAIQRKTGLVAGGDGMAPTQIPEQMDTSAGLQSAARAARTATPQYSFGDQTFATMQEAQQAIAPLRTAGLADVYRGYGMEDRASQLEAQAQQQQLTGLQLRRGQREEATENKILDVDKRSSEYLTKRLTNADGTMRTADATDLVAQVQNRAVLLNEAGLGREATKALQDWQGIAVNTMQLQKGQRENDLQVAVGALATSGDLGPARAFYDKYVLDGAKVTNLKQNKDGSITVSRVRDDGVKLPDEKLASVQALVAGLNSFRDPMALYNYSQDQFKNNLQVRQVAATEASAKAAQSRAEDARELTKANKGLIDARIANLEARTKALGEAPPLSEAQVTARAKEMLKSRPINPQTKKPYTITEATEFIKSGGRDPVADALDRALGGNIDPFAD